MFCIKCGRSFDSGVYCKYCGTLLREKILNYETTGTLLKTNVNLDEVKNIVPDTISKVSKPKEFEDVYSDSSLDPKFEKNLFASQEENRTSYTQGTKNKEEPFALYIPIATAVPEKAETVSPETVVEEALNKGVDFGDFADIIDNKATEEPEKKLSEKEELSFQTVEPIAVQVEVPAESIVEDEPIQDIGFEDFADIMNKETIEEPEKELSEKEEPSFVPTVEPIAVQVEVPAEPIVEDEPIQDIGFEDFADIMNKETIEEPEKELSEKEEPSFVPTMQSILEEASAEPVVEEKALKVEKNVEEQKKDDSFNRDLDSKNVEPQQIASNRIDPMFGEAPEMNYTMLSSVESIKARRVPSNEGKGFFRKRKK